MSSDISNAYVVTLLDERRLRNFTVARDSLGIVSMSLDMDGVSGPSVLVHNDETGMLLLAGAGTELFDGARPVTHFDLETVQTGKVLMLCDQHTGSKAVAIIRPSSLGAKTFMKMAFSADVDISIGRGSDNGICYRIPFVSEHHALLQCKSGVFSIVDTGSANGTFVNGRRLVAQRKCELAPGDIVQILDLVFTVGLRFISINQPPSVSFRRLPGWHESTHDDIIRADSEPVVADSGAEAPLFYPAPRLMHSIHVKTFQVDAPPQSPVQEHQSALMQLGPSFLMGISSLFMAFSAVSKIAHGGDVMSALPQIMMAIAMVGGTVIWPLISSRYTKKHAEKEERERQSKYTDYLNSTTAKVLQERNRQIAVLEENRVPIGTVLERASSLSERLMDRNRMHADFLQLRVGVGDTHVQADIKAPKHSFTMKDDALLEKAETLADKPTAMRAPIAVDLAQVTSLGIVGDRAAVWDFTRGLLAQVCGLYSYDEVKLMVLARPGESNEWDFARRLPHACSDDRKMRYLAEGSAGLSQIDKILADALSERQKSGSGKKSDVVPFYVVLCTDKMLASSSQAISKLSVLKENLGFCVVFIGDELKDLPQECSEVIELGKPTDEQRSRGDYGLGTYGVLAGSSRMFDRNDVGGTEQRFVPDILLSAGRAERFALDVSHARLETVSSRASMPESLGFMEMFQAGNVLQLNIADRWRKHDSSRSLATPLGLGENGQPVMLDLHENAHGPHGLIAGTTGSGKSELIISWILSLAINYSPDEAEFVLIDYKGGGLAGAFDNSRYHLPHLAGTITNLDGDAISRSLVSIQSELKRRQAAFNEARDATGEATMDINKYISYFRQGVLKKPIPHLFVVADEFAELKQQEPEFMDQLVSAARIGRSLGMHLVLATQKPSGVVNDQITSNARFKISLKVADASDSREMLNRTDAAELDRPGAFYLLVGFDELFVGGQSAYTGVDYVERDTYEPRHDNSVELVNLQGQALAQLRPETHETSSGTSELNAVLGQLMEVGHASGKGAKPLWLAPLPGHLQLDDVRNRFGFKPDADGLTSVVGVLDDPANQRQDIFTVDFASESNVIIYGVAGSGTEALMTSMLCSLMSDYSPDELNIYVWDMGAGSLSALSAAPHVGGVALLADSERVNNLFLLLEDEVNARRSLFMSTGGSYKAYRESLPDGEKPVPRIVVALIDIASFNEAYDQYTERLNALARDAPRYGIYFSFTASAWNQPNTRLKPSLGRVLVTSFTKDDDYQNVLNGTRKVVLPKGYLAGLFQSGKTVTRFQGASLGEEISDEAQSVRDFCKGLSISWKGDCAPSIPTLPEHVHVSMFDAVKNARFEIPVGYSKDDARPAAYDASRSAMLVSADDPDALHDWFDALRQVLHKQQRVFAILDSEDMLEGVDDESLISKSEDIDVWVQGLLSGAIDTEIAIIPSLMQFMDSLKGDTGTQFKEYIERQQFKNSTAFVMGGEAWRMRSGYDPWHKSLMANANGLWIGDGFTSQSIFQHNLLPEILKRPMRPIDGVLHVNAVNDRIQLFEPEQETQGKDE